VKAGGEHKAINETKLTENENISEMLRKKK
jgi:hypothetical protein